MNRYPKPSFVKYTAEQAAIHEIGHALTASFIGFRFQYVEIVRSRHLGWKGQCRAETVEGIPQVVLDAFAMGGPIMQLARAPASLGPHTALFPGTLFGKAREVVYCSHACPVVELGWYFDVGHSGMMTHAMFLNNSPECPFGMMNRDWLLVLERELLQIFQRSSTGCLIKEIAPRLISRQRVSERDFRRSVRRQVADLSPASLSNIVAKNISR